MTSRPMLGLGRVRGVPVLIAPSWLVVAVLLSAVYGPELHDAVPGVGSGLAYLAAFGFTVLLAACVLLHEIGHTLVSLALGHPVRRIVLFALGGVSEVDDDPERPRDEFLIALAGPLVSVAIAAGAFGLRLTAPDGTLLEALLVLLAWSNTVLAAFNLLPGLPLDGGRLLRALVCALGAGPLTATRIAAWAGRLVAVGIVVAGLFVDRSSAGISAGLVTVALAGYLGFGATQALRVAQLQARLPGIDVGALLRPGLLVRADLPVSEAVRRAAEGNARGLVVLDAADRPSAIVDEALVMAMPPERRDWTVVSSIARPLEPGLIVPVGIDARDLLDRMQRTPAREYLVQAADGSPAGIISTRDFVRALSRFA